MNSLDVLGNRFNKEIKTNSNQEDAVTHSSDGLITAVAIGIISLLYAINTRKGTYLAFG